IAQVFWLRSRRRASYAPELEPHTPPVSDVNQPVIIHASQSRVNSLKGTPTTWGMAPPIMMLRSYGPRLQTISEACGRRNAGAGNEIGQRGLADAGFCVPGDCGKRAPQLPVGVSGAG